LLLEPEAQVLELVQLRMEQMALAAVQVEIPQSP